MSKTFLFQVNVTRDCNLRCTHCYISTEKKVSSKYMDKVQYISVFTQIAAFLNSEHAKAIGYSFADIHVIGGEPTMLGYEFFEETMPLVHSLMKSVKIKYKLSIVSNLVTKDAVIISSLFDQVATSYEVDTRFVSIKGNKKPSIEKYWNSNVSKLKNTGREVSITMAVTRQAIDYGASNILDDFVGLGFNQIHLGFFIPSGDGRINAGQIAPSFYSTSKYMIEAADWYLEKRNENPLLYVNPIESLIEAIYFGRPSDDIVCPIIPGSLDIDWNGETVTCIEAGGEIGYDSLGNVFNDDIATILKGDKYLRERSKAVRPQKNCIGCDELELCQSACGILHKQWSGRGECPGFKAFIKHVRSLVEDQSIKPKSIIGSSEDEFRAC